MDVAGLVKIIQRDNRRSSQATSQGFDSLSRKFVGLTKAITQQNQIQQRQNQRTDLGDLTKAVAQQSQQQKQQQKQTIIERQKIVQSERSQKEKEKRNEVKEERQFGKRRDKADFEFKKEKEEVDLEETNEHLEEIKGLLGNLNGSGNQGPLEGLAGSIATAVATALKALPWVAILKGAGIGAAIAAAVKTTNSVNNAVYNLKYRSGKTESGLIFEGQDVVEQFQEKRAALQKKGETIPVEEMKKWEKLESAMQQGRGLQATIDQKQKRRDEVMKERDVTLKKWTDAIKKETDLRKKRNLQTSMQTYTVTQNAEIVKLNEELRTLNHNNIQNKKIITKLGTELLDEKDIIQRQLDRGTRVTIPDKFKGQVQEPNLLRQSVSAWGSAEEAEKQRNESYKKGYYQGGMFRVPGIGSGDKVAANLQNNDFVLNREATNHFFPKYQNGGNVLLEPGESVFTQPNKQEQKTLTAMNKALPRMMHMQTGGAVDTNAGAVAPLEEVPQNQMGSSRTGDKTPTKTEKDKKIESEAAEAAKGLKGNEAILEAAKNNIGDLATTNKMCAVTTRNVLRAANHPAADKVTTKGDLDKPIPNKWTSNPAAAASFAGSDMGAYTDNPAQVKPGNIVLWKNTYSEPGDVPGSITHIGIKGEGNSVYHHALGPGWRKTGLGTGNFAWGIDLDGTGGTTSNQDSNSGASIMEGLTNAFAALKDPAKLASIGQNLLSLASGNPLAALSALAGGPGVAQVAPGLLGLFGGGKKKTDSSSSSTSSSGEAPPVTKGAKGLLDFIAHYESEGDYNKIFGGESIPGLTEMSINEVVKVQKQHLKKGHESAAIGRYQMMLPEQYADKAGVPRTAKFSAENQDKIAMVYLEEDGWSSFKAGSMSSEKFADNVAGTWAAMPTSSGASAHEGVGSNKSLVDRATFMKHIEAAKLQKGGVMRGHNALLEPGEMVIKQPTPQLKEQLQSMNDSVPRFQTGGVVGGRNQVKSSDNLTMNEFKQTNEIYSHIKRLQETQVQAAAVQTAAVGGSPTPNPGGIERGNPVGMNLPNEPTSHIASSLMMQQYTLSSRIG